ncbi:MAG: hypothetical protein NTV34_03025, partial [Proteobacteria bacterium]|nr:hypothetical protein [Pseudomonadota bacterium]
MFAFCKQTLHWRVDFTSALWGRCALMLDGQTSDLYFFDAENIKNVEFHENFQKIFYYKKFFNSFSCNPNWM